MPGNPSYSKVSRAVSRKFQRQSLYSHLEDGVRSAELTVLPWSVECHCGAYPMSVGRNAEHVERLMIEEKMNRTPRGHIQGLTNKPLPPALVRLWQVCDPVQFGRGLLPDHTHTRLPGSKAEEQERFERLQRRESSRRHAQSLRIGYNMSTPRGRPPTFMPLNSHVAMTYPQPNLHPPVFTFRHPPR